MPIFNYVCEKCGYNEDIIVKSSEVKTVECSKCNGISIQQFPNTMKFLLLYDPKKDKVSWGNEGYQTTRRYEEINKQK